MEPIIQSRRSMELETLGLSIPWKTMIDNPLEYMDDGNLFLVEIYPDEFQVLEFRTNESVFLDERNNGLDCPRFISLSGEEFDAYEIDRFCLLEDVISLFGKKS